MPDPIQRGAVIERSNLAVPGVPVFAERNFATWLRAGARELRKLAAAPEWTLSRLKCSGGAFSSFGH